MDRPQNEAGVKGHYQYTGSAPIFVTTKLEDLERLERLASNDPRTGKPRSGNASMALRRLKVYPYTCRIPKPPPCLPCCSHCFASYVFEQAASQAHPAPAPSRPQSAGGLTFL